MPQALVLNASLEPLSVVPVRRALVLVLADRADVVASNGVVWHSEYITMPSPSVIQLRRYVSVPYSRRVPVNRRTVFHRDRYSCQYCGRQTSQLTIDHVAPRYRGGQHSWENLVAACPHCNRRKGGRTLAEVRMKLLRRPFEPRPTAQYLFGRYLAGDGLWTRYLEGW